MKLSEKELMVIGARISTERKRQGLTQRRLATMLGYTSHSYLSNVERGKKKPSLNMLCELSEIFEVELEYFLTEL